MRLLIVEDDRDIVKALTALFEHNNYSVDAVYNGNDGYDYAVGGSYDGIVMDIMMPGMDGLQVLHALRSAGIKTPVLLLTAKGDIEDKVNGLDAGADDYLPKPFAPDELLSRVRALLRRTGESAPQRTGELYQPPFLLNLTNRTLEKNGERVKLTQIEYAIVKLFMENSGKALAREEILDAVWGKGYFGELKIVDVNIRRLRLKIEDDAQEPRYIATVWGTGYKWSTD